MILTLLGCVPDSPQPLAASGPTWHQDVAPIVAEHCSNCHTDGAIGPFALETYADVQAMGAAVVASVESRRMPPWIADSTCNDYLYDPSLSDADVATLVGWLDVGMPEGDPASAAPLPAGAGRRLSRVDHTLEVRTAYTPTQAPDDYRCFVVDWPETETMYVTGYDVRPGNAEIVHHVIAYVAAPDQVALYEAADAADPGEGWTCFGGPGVGSQEEAEWLGGWAPGGSNGDLPNGTGISVEPGSLIVLQVHYNTANADAAEDLTEVDVMVEAEVENPARIQPWTDPSWLDSDRMLIPAGAEGVEHSFSYTIPDGVQFQIHTSNLHMHQLGTDARMWVEEADGTERCLLDIPAWDFNWQRTYVFEEPYVMQGGGSIHVACHWDNPTDADVVWGEGTGDEMCLGTMLWSY